MTARESDAEFEQKWLRQAEAAMQTEHWADATVGWEILSLLKPQKAEYTARLAEARGRARRAADESVNAAREARKRGDVQHATTLYLKALAAGPEREDIIQALRELGVSQAPHVQNGMANRNRSATRTMKPGTPGVDEESVR